MTCERCRERLLEAHPSELDPDADGELSSHLRECADCRRVAAAVREQHARLADALALVERRYAPRPRSRRRTRLAAMTLVPVGVAAAIATLLLVRARPDGAEPLDPPPELLYAALNPPRPIVETPAGVRAAVIRTDRDVTVVLLYDEEMSR